MRKSQFTSCCSPLTLFLLILLQACGTQPTSDAKKIAPKEDHKKISRTGLSSDELRAGQHYYVKAVNGKFLAFSQREGFYLSEEQNKTFFEVIETHDNKIFIKSAHGDYISARDDASIKPSKRALGWEAFNLIYQKDNSFYLQSFHGTYLSVNLQTQTLEQTPTPPAREQSIAIVKAYDSETYRQAIRSTQLPTDKDRLVWTFWDSGCDKMPPFYQLNIKGWQHILGSRWKIKVLNIVENDDDNAFNYLDKDDLPRAFEQLSPVMKSDAVRIALLKKYGGVWMDASNILLQNLDQICWQEMSNQNKYVVVAGFYNDGWGSEHLGRKDFFENWFVAARKNNKFIELWHKVFNEYWNDRTESSDIWQHPLYTSLDLTNFNRYGSDFRNYLTQHIAFRKLLESDPHMRMIWEQNMLLRNAGDEAFYLTKFAGWDSQSIHHKLIEESDESLVAELIKLPLMKFTSAMAADIKNLSEEELRDSKHTLGKLYKHIFEK